ncbi:MAG TPA: sensor histidine kinase [Desulfobacteria bacterium]|nr:sensor histidine kinase [Desulfobacteria bacterium]
MLPYDIFIKLTQNTTEIVTLAYLISRTTTFKNVMRHRTNLADKLLLVLIFSAIAVIGTYTGISIKGALANSRVIGVVVGSLLGGPAVGIAVGLIASIHRYFIGGFTAFSCALATMAEALFTVLLTYKSDPEKLSWEKGLVIGIVAETLQMLIILATARPFAAAWDLVRVIGLPMIILNSAGITIFVAIIRATFDEEEKIGAMQAQKSLQIANITLPILRQGLSRESAAAVAKIILNHTQVEAVAITDRQQILAHVGSGAGHHLSGSPIMTEATKQVIASGTFKIAETKRDIGCTNKDCILTSAVIVPLISREEIVGALKLYRKKEHSIGNLDIKLAQGLAGLFSTQLELAALEEQAQLVAQAELKALQAQINPHFLFNALNTIVSFCRSDSEKARELLIQLGEFLRKNIQRGYKFVTLREELEHVRAYLSIEQARFGDTLTVVEEIDRAAEDWQLPALTLQPLVENSIKHGIYPKINGGTIWVRCWVKDNALQVEIEDNGVGISSSRLAEIQAHNYASVTGAGIGLQNVSDRLKYLYGRDNGVKISSVEKNGTVVSIKIPVSGGKKAW